MIFPVIVSPNAGDPLMYARFDFNDVTEDGDTDDLVNPFAIAGYGGNTSALDGKSLTLTQQEAVSRVTLHEVGHALGRSGHGGTRPSVLINKLGPFCTEDFDVQEDIPLMNLHWLDDLGYCDVLLELEQE